MKLFSVAIGDKYEREALRLQRSVPLSVEVFTKSSNGYIEVSKDPLINGLWHKCNFANYIEEADGPIIFMDADMFTLREKPFDDFATKEDADIAYVPYDGKWFYPDKIRQLAFDFHKHKINSGFLYFKNLQIAKDVCSRWSNEYSNRIKLYEIGTNNVTKFEYDEYALMIALMNLNYNIELLDKKWNDWELETKEEILASDSIFFQSHEHLDII